MLFARKSCTSRRQSRFEGTLLLHYDHIPMSSDFLGLRLLVLLIKNLNGVGAEYDRPCQPVLEGPGCYLTLERLRLMFVERSATLLSCATAYWIRVLFSHNRECLYRLRSITW